MSKEIKTRAAFQARGVGASRIGGLLGAAAIAALVASIAQPVAAAQPSSGDTNAVGEVIVTARHRTEAAQSVPTAVSVVAGDFLVKTNLTNFQQLVNYIPSVQFTMSNPRNSSINIRGLGNASGVSADSIEPGVGFYVDQVYYNRPATTTFDLADIDQVEVLRGPQGTLYGKNTTAGAIYITTASPTFKPQASGEITGGDYGYFSGKATVSGPLIGDVLAGRLSFSTSQINGLETNAYNGAKVDSNRNQTIRGQLLFTPSDDLKFRLIADYSKQYADCCASILTNIVPVLGKSFVSYAEAFGYTPVVDPTSRQVDINSPQFWYQENGGVSLQAEKSLPGATFTSITAWRYWYWAPGNDLDSTPLNIITAGNTDSHENQFTQEFRIASSGEHLIDYVAGLFYYHELITSPAVMQYGNAGSYFLLGPTVPAAALQGVTSYNLGSNTTNSYAAFGQATYHITSQLSLTGGVRYTYDAKNGHFEQTVQGGAPVTALALIYRNAVLPVVPRKEATVNGGAPSGQLGLSYQLTKDVLAYATYAHGSRSGGINLSATAGIPFTVKPETIDSGELGLKTAWFDRHVTLNLAAYLEDDTNYIGNLVVTGTTQTYLANIPKVESKGVEADLHADPNRYVSIYVSAAYDDADYKNYTNAPCPPELLGAKKACNLDGRPLAGVPLWNASAGGEFRYPLTFGARQVEAYIGVDDTYRSSIYTNTNESIYSRVPPLNLLDARFGVRSADGRWDAFVWGKNITNQFYYTTQGEGIGNLGAIYATLGDPATWGVTLRARF